MENMPKFEVVGKVTDNDKRKFQDAEKDVFLRQEKSVPETDEDRLEIEKTEIAKTPEQVAILNFINNETNRLMDECGVEPYDLPINNYHILPKEQMKKYFNVDTSGVYEPKFYAIGLSEELNKSLLKFAIVALHESLHAKSRQIMELFTDNDGVVRAQGYRGGVRAFSPHGKDEEGRPVGHFTGLDEAIIAWQEKLSFSKLLEIPELAKEKEELQTEEAIKLRKNIAKEDDIAEDEVYSIDSEGEYNSTGYRRQRSVLEYVCEEIATEFSDEYPTKEDVFRVFLKAEFDGNLIPIARLMKKTFGEHGFRTLSIMKGEDEAGVTSNVSEMLRKFRREIKNK